MKKFIPILFAFVIFSLAAPAQNLENPGAYMTAISNAQEVMNKSYMSYMSAGAHSGRARKIEKLRNQVLENITNSRYKTIDLPIYKGDNTLRQASIDYIKLCYDVFNEDYNKIVNMEEIIEQSFDQMQAYLLLQEKTNEKIREAGDKMTKASDAFAAKYDVKVTNVSNELSEKMEASSKLIHYKNQVYLIFLKCNWQDRLLAEAVNKKKVNDIEQSRNAMIRYADEGLSELEKVGGYDGDRSYAAACKSSLQAYQTIAVTMIPKITDFFLKEESFDKTKKSYELKSGSDRTKEDVNTYNKAVNEINAAVNIFNQTLVNITNQRNQVLQNWQSNEKAFLDNHMPHYK